MTLRYLKTNKQKNCQLTERDSSLSGGAPGGTQSQVGCGSGQLDPVGGSPVHSRQLEMAGL